LTSETVIQSRDKEYDWTDLREQSHWDSLRYRADVTQVHLALNPIKDQDYLDAACETVCPLQSACGQSQAMSGVFSIASHSVLQYFPDVTLQEQMGWAHFLLSAIESPFR
jgi:hypothetical protein